MTVQLAPHIVQLVTILADGHYHTCSQIADKLGKGNRTITRWIVEARSGGFHITGHGNLGYMLVQDTRTKSLTRKVVGEPAFNYDKHKEAVAAHSAASLAHFNAEKDAWNLTKKANLLSMACGMDAVVALTGAKASNLHAARAALHKRIIAKHLSNNTQRRTGT